MTLGNGLAVTNAWGDPATGSVTGDGRLAARRLYRTSDNASLSDLAYSYDADGNIASITDQVNASGSVLYGYDSMGRLTLTAIDGGGAGAQSYRLLVIRAPYCLQPVLARCADRVCCRPFFSH